MTRFVMGKQGNLYNYQHECSMDEYLEQVNKINSLNTKWNKICKALFNSKKTITLPKEIRKAKKFKKYFVKEYNTLVAMHRFLKLAGKSLDSLISPKFKQADIILSHKLFPANVKYNPMSTKQFNAHKEELLLHHNGDKQRLTIQKQSLLNRLERLDRIHNFKGKKSYIKSMTDEDYAKAVDFANKSLQIVENKLANI